MWVWKQKPSVNTRLCVLICCVMYLFFKERRDVLWWCLKQVVTFKKVNPLVTGALYFCWQGSFVGGKKKHLPNINIVLSWSVSLFFFLFVLPNTRNNLSFRSTILPVSRCWLADSGVSWFWLTWCTWSR